MREFSVTAVQMESLLGEIRTNARRMRSWMDEAVRQNSQFVVFPECCLTGYSTACSDRVAILASDEEAIKLEQYAGELGIAIGYGYMEACVSAGDEGKRGFERNVKVDGDAGCGFGSNTSEDDAVDEGFLRNCANRRDEVEALESRPKMRSNSSDSARFSDKPYITYVVAGPEGRLVYRKSHLGSKEQQAFAAGDALPVARIAGVSVGVQLCWEAHIPDITGALRAKGAELVLMPHAVGTDVARRMELWGRYLPARAYDNGLFVIACNALRRNGEGVLVGGGIVAYGPDGTRIAACERTEGGMLSVRVGGVLPRELPDGGMRGASYFDRRRPELYLA